MSIFTEAEDIINGERKEEYGDAEYNFEIIAEYWTIYLDHEDITLSGVDVGHMMALLKIARMRKRHKRDNYRDAIGYLGLVADRLYNGIPEIIGTWVEPEVGTHNAKGERHDESSKA